METGNTAVLTLQSVTVLYLCGFICLAQAGIYALLLKSTKDTAQRAWLAYELLMGVGFLWLVMGVNTPTPEFPILAALLVMGAYLSRFIAVVRTFNRPLLKKPLIISLVTIALIGTLFVWSSYLGAPLGSLETIVLLPLGVASGVTAWYLGECCTQKLSFVMLWMSRILWAEAVIYVLLALGALAGIGQDYVNLNSHIILNLCLFTFVVQLVLHVLWVIHSAVDKQGVFKTAPNAHLNLKFSMASVAKTSNKTTATSSKANKAKEEAVTEEVLGDSHLTAKEVEVLKLVVQGLKNKEIAQAMQISEASVKVHKSRMTTKLGVKTLPALKQALEKLDTTHSSIETEQSTNTDESVNHSEEISNSEAVPSSDSSQKI